MLRRYVRPSLGERVLTALRPLDLQTIYQQMMERGLSARTVRYTHAVLRFAMRQALNWRLLLESPVDGLKLPQQSRHEMQALTVDQVRMFLKAALATPHGPALAEPSTDQTAKLDCHHSSSPAYAENSGDNFQQRVF
jgi:site-specific recombinase XerC